MNIKITQIGRHSAVRTRFASDVQAAVAMLRHCTSYRWCEAEGAWLFDVLADQPSRCRTYVVHGDADAVQAVLQAAKAQVRLR